MCSEFSSAVRAVAVDGACILLYSTSGRFREVIKNDDSGLVQL